MKCQRPIFDFQNPPFCPGSPQHTFMIFLGYFSPTLFTQRWNPNVQTFLTKANTWCRNITIRLQQLRGGAYQLPGNLLRSRSEAFLTHCINMEIMKVGKSSSWERLRYQDHNLILELLVVLEETLVRRNSVFCLVSVFCCEHTLFVVAVVFSTRYFHDKSVGGNNEHHPGGFSCFHIPKLSTRKYWTLKRSIEERLCCNTVSRESDGEKGREL